MVRYIFKLLLAIMLSCFVSALLTIFDFSILAIFTSVGFGAVGAWAAGHLVNGDKKGGAVVLFICFIMVSTAGIMADGMIDHPLWTIKAEGINLKDVSKHPHATVFYFRNGQARPDLMETADIWGSSGKGGSHRIDKAFVVPIVSEDWTPDRPVKVWAVSKRENYSEQSENWKSSVRGGARTIGLNVSDYQNAIDMAKEIKNLVPDESPLLIELSPRPEDLVRAAWIRLGWIAGIDFFLTLAVILVGIVIQKFQKDDRVSP